MPVLRGTRLLAFQQACPLHTCLKLNMDLNLQISQFICLQSDGCPRKLKVVDRPQELTSLVYVAYEHCHDVERDKSVVFKMHIRKEMDKLIGDAKRIGPKSLRAELFKKFGEGCPDVPGKRRASATRMPRPPLPCTATTHPDDCGFCRSKRTSIAIRREQGEFQRSTPSETSSPTPRPIIL